MKRPLLLVGVLVAANLVSAVAVVVVKHRVRELHTELQALRVERDRLNTEWAQLQLEESAWANPDRLAKRARQRLDMHQPRAYTILGEGR